MKAKTKLFIRTILLEKNISYVQLAKMMNEKGYIESSDTIRTKIHRGSFSFSFLLQVCDTLDLDLITIEKK